VSSLSRKLLLRLQVKRGLLLRHYDDEALHQFRVAIRRLRSVLRHAGDSEAQALCHDLGKLADLSNAARDWDTLLCLARDKLKPKAFHHVQPLLQEKRLASHAQVLEMLRSTEWSDTIRALEDYVTRHLSAGKTLPDEEVARARHDVRRAWARLQEEDDSKQWHKLRIAIKELRYTLERVSRAAQEPRLSRALKRCKRLQETLGLWHDTAVHLQMVRELASGLDPDVESELNRALNSWCKQMERERRDYLHSARSYVERKGSDLLR
jgi:CHAD domain-containing protein